MIDPDHISAHLKELLEELTADQIFHIWSCKRARENAEPPPDMEWEMRERTVEERVYRFAQWARSWGADEDLIAADLYRKLLKFGYGDEGAAEVLRDVGIVSTRLEAA